MMSSDGAAWFFADIDFSKSYSMSNYIYLEQDGKATYYSTSINFQILEWNAELWYGDEYISENTWEFHNSNYNYTARHADDINEMKEAVVDPYTDVYI